MNLLLFGVSNVGKSTTGLILSGKLGFAFHDLDDEVKQEYKTTLEVFVNTGTLRERDAKRCRIIKDVIHKDDSDKIIAVSPITYVDAINPLMRSKDILAVELCDSAENIFDRLVFSDENDIIYTDDEYKNQHRDHYLEDINEDIEWYGNIYSAFCKRFYMNGVPPEEVADRLINEFHLT